MGGQNGKENIYFRFFSHFRWVLLPANLVQAAERKVYNKYNIHTQMKGAKKFNASYANYTRPGDGHFVIPAGTLLTVLEIDPNFDSFAFKLEDGGKIEFAYSAGRMGMSNEKYIELITSPTPISLEGFSELDRKGIKEGKALVGMSKDGVLTALGYPASHRTPSLLSNSWVYWTNRWGTIRVDYDDGGKVAKIVD